MNNVIHLLDPEAIGQIAAGEVIERPASVVKELVENAIDAGATRIAVRVRVGGIAEIEVADDGAGIAPGELALALARHATSKLDGAGGLLSIRTLGFRGEGLASIAAVARVRLISRPPGAEVGTAIEAFGESISETEVAATPPGTRVIVRDLFANVPVRREYLRAPSTEFARISTWLSTLALAYPEIAFSLEHDGKPVFTFGIEDGIYSRLAHTFGPAAARTLLPLGPHESVGVCVEGYISPPGSDRPDRRLQFLFVNRRLLRSGLLIGAWTAAYRTFAMVGRYPYGIVFLDVQPADVDPNVHPTKSDVRLRHNDHVVSVVREAMAATLRRSAGERLQQAISFVPDVAAAEGENGSAQSLDFGFDEAEIDPDRTRVLGQLARSFVVAGDADALVLIDQHAAHERIAYEMLLRNASAQVQHEPLLVPFVFEVTAPEAERLERSLEALAAAGFEIEPFGERTYRLTATPFGFPRRGAGFDVAGFLDGLDDDVRGLGANERVWASVACHSVVRAGETLAPAEMATLVARLRKCENPMHCPHGRPTIVRLEADAVARLFKRA
ncbi:MAG TPA: DNA mismatch repair endonuclease MutL [Candidatus Binatia bacterium]|nr:DNA mismatch repair endonuclease MutL [Candidatus Binatia bacterium]